MWWHKNIHTVAMTISEKFATVKKACDNRLVCEVHIKNEPSVRVVQPLGVCLTNRRGLVVVCKQVDGYSKSLSFSATCNFSLDDCKDIRILESKFKVPDRIDGPDFCQDWLVRV